MPSRLTIHEIDADSDKGQVSFDGVTISAANHDAIKAAMTALADAIEDLCLTNMYQRTFTAAITAGLGGDTPPANPAAQIHTQWLFTFKDTVTGVIYRRRVHGADYSKATEQDLYGLYVPLTAGEGLALKTAFEAYVQEVAGNAVELLRVDPLEK